MKQFLTPVFLLLVAAAMLWTAGCNASEKATAGEAVVTEFFAALAKDAENAQPNLELLKKYYPDIDRLQPHHKSNAIVILGSGVSRGKVTVEVRSTYTAPNGRTSENLIDIILTSQGGDYKIVDSRGITDYSTDKFYEFALRTGCLDPEGDPTDLEARDALDRAAKLMDKMIAEMSEEYKDGVVFEDWDWKKGIGRMVNKTAPALDHPQYLVRYIDASGNEIGRAENVIQEVLPEGGSLEFNVITAVPEMTASSLVELTVHPEKFAEKVMEQDFSGDECDDL